MNATIKLEQKHIPVLLDELISIISPLYGGTFIDCTFGQGGYSKKILSNKNNKVVALDRDPETLIEAKKLLKKFKGRIEIPTDVALNIDGKRYGTNVSNLPQDHSLYDIGIDTLVNYINIIEKAGTIIANGPMGVFEDSEFATGTNEVFSAISKSDGMTVVGGGETAMAFNQMGLADGIRHISTGGGACISFMSGETMPALEAMRRSKNKFNK